jgi:hypothetical protein
MTGVDTLCGSPWVSGGSDTTSTGDTLSIRSHGDPGISLLLTFGWLDLLNRNCLTNSGVSEGG